MVLELTINTSMVAKNINSYASEENKIFVFDLFLLRIMTTLSRQFVYIVRSAKTRVRPTMIKQRNQQPS